MSDVKKSIVAVDDSGLILKTLEKILGEQYDFKGFSKGMRALQYLKSTTPSLILLDIDMPEIDGYEMLRLIHEKDSLKYVPVIFLTSNNDKKHVVDAVALGANSYVVKPVNEEILMGKIHDLLHDKSHISWDDIK